MGKYDGMYYDRNGNPMSMEEWAASFELRHTKDYKQVAFEDMGEVHVSTVWLGLNHNMTGIGPPLIFETMIFGGPHDRWMKRYPTEAAAIAGHDQAVAALREGQAP